jgi:hypothetical protein
MNARIPLQPGQRKAMKKEVAREARETTALLELNLEAAVIDAGLQCGYYKGPKGARRFYETIVANLDKMLQRYDMDEDDATYLLLRDLKQQGIDLEAWHKESKKQLVFKV